jgi:hypothetical protein
MVSGEGGRRGGGKGKAERNGILRGRGGGGGGRKGGRDFQEKIRKEDADQWTSVVSACVLQRRPPLCGSPSRGSEGGPGREGGMRGIVGTGEGDRKDSK